MYIVMFVHILYSVQCILNMCVQCMCTVYIEPVYSVQCTVYSVQCTGAGGGVGGIYIVIVHVLYSVQCTMYSVQCTVYIERVCVCTMWVYNVCVQEGGRNVHCYCTYTGQCTVYLQCTYSVPTVYNVY